MKKLLKIFAALSIVGLCTGAVLVNGIGSLVMFGKISNTEVRAARLNPQTHAQNVISYEHHEIHNGSHYELIGYADLSINQVMQFTIQTPNTTKWAHFTWAINTESETLWEIYEAATINTTPSTNNVPHNNNRNSANTTALTLNSEVYANTAAADADVDVSGATLLQIGISGTGRDAGQAHREHELILKQNTIYCMRGTANAAGYINFEMQYYEHTDKD